MDRYLQRGVSSSKEDVHKAISGLDKGVFPQAFCKIIEDPFYPGELMLLHADGAGTKSSLAYAYWRETGDLSVWKGIAQDAVVMNTDDLMCTGAVDTFVVSSTIGRNKNLIPGEVISAIIDGTREFAESMSQFGINIVLAGGETADVGDLVRTIIVDSTVLSRLPKGKVISNDRICAGDVIIGFASYGQSVYESSFNSGMGSNGLTSARHDMFCAELGLQYPETFDSAIPETVRYTGKYRLTDHSPVEGIDMGKYVLSPTRTYLPLVREILGNLGPDIHGMVHCTGGGQAKVLHFVDGLKIVKNNLLPIPALFALIQESSGASWQEMFRVFNMGHRLEMYVPEKIADQLIHIAEQFGIDSAVIGHVIDCEKAEVELHGPEGVLHYFKQ